MRIAAIYDIHANLSALEAVLQEIRQAKVDCVVVGGDVLPGPLPSETIQCLLDLDIPAQFIHGNGDREVLAQMSGMETDWYRTAPEQWRVPVRWTAQQLDTQHHRLLEGWPPTCQVEIPGLGDVLFCHATPRNDTEIFTRLTPDDRLLPIFEGLGVSVVVCGHTHMQFDRMVGTTRVVNAGSVGMPFGEPAPIGCRSTPMFSSGTLATILPEPPTAFAALHTHRPRTLPRAISCIPHPRKKLSPRSREPS